MFEAGAPSTLRVLEMLREPDVRWRVDEIAARFAGSGEAADALVVEALALVCDPERLPWDPQKTAEDLSELAFVQHMGDVMLRLHREHRRTQRSRRDLVDAGVLQDRPPPRDALEEHERKAAEALLVDRETIARARRLGGELRASLTDDDPLAVRVLDAVCRGARYLSEIIGAVSRPAPEVKKALLRISYRAARIQERDDAAFTRRQHRPGASRPRTLPGGGTP